MTECGLTIQSLLSTERGAMLKDCELQWLMVYMSYLCLSEGQPFLTGVPATVYSSPDSSGSTCPSQDTINEEHRRIRDSILTSSDETVPCSCGGPGWTRAVYLNMTDPDHSCPPNWNLTTSPVRGCGRTTLTGASCDSAIFPVDRVYSKVCGQINAYQKDISGAFFNNLVSTITLESSYVSGVSLTHGEDGSRQHIWTFVGAIYEDESHPTLNLDHKCPCTDANVTWPFETPSFIGNDYFCETGKKTAFVRAGTVYVDDPLWDGKGCGPASTCCSFNTPPLFCKSLPQPTSDHLEIRLCYTSPAQNENKFISLIDIYVK